MNERFKNFTVLISKIGRGIRKIKTEEMSEFNLKSPHVSCLYYLYKMGDMSATKLCEVCAEDKAAISRSIDFLEENGYITCDSNLKKRYNSLLSLTNKGLEVSEKIAFKIDNILNCISNDLPDDKRAIMYEGLNFICERLEKYCEKYEGDK